MFVEKVPSPLPRLNGKAKSNQMLSALSVFVKIVLRVQ